jgi:hypothetical protein
VEIVRGGAADPGIGALMNMSMLSMQSGRERELSELDTLLATAGFRRTQLTPRVGGEIVTRSELRQEPHVAHPSVSGAKVRADDHVGGVQRPDQDAAHEVRGGVQAIVVLKGTTSTASAPCSTRRSRVSSEWRPDDRCRVRVERGEDDGDPSAPPHRPPSAARSRTRARPRWTPSNTPSTTTERPYGDGIRSVP